MLAEEIGNLVEAESEAQKYARGIWGTSYGRSSKSTSILDKIPKPSLLYPSAVKETISKAYNKAKSVGKS